MRPVREPNFFLGFLGDMITGSMNYNMQQQNLAWQKEQWEQVKQREDTAQQRAVADMAKAGINPNLAAGQGSPTSSAPQTEAPQFQSIGESADNMLGSALSVTDAVNNSKLADISVAQGLNDIASKNPQLKQDIDKALRDKLSSSSSRDRAEITTVKPRNKQTEAYTKLTEEQTKEEKLRNQFGDAYGYLPQDASQLSTKESAGAIALNAYQKYKNYSSKGDGSKVTGRNYMGKKIH